MTSHTASMPVAAGEVHATDTRHNDSLSRQLPRLGFLGVGWIGKHRLEAVARSGLAEIAGVAEPSEELRGQAAALAPRAPTTESLDELLELELDGLVIATPSALHADQTIRALDAGLAVFCQKPLGRNAAETAACVDAARRADRLLGVDLSYRFTDAMRRIRPLLDEGTLGRVYAVDLTFHNAYGPDKPWFRDPALSGGGCVMDLGVHLVDLALWALHHPSVESARGRLFSGGQPLEDPRTQVEDFASAELTLGDGTLVRLACSWNLAAGQDAVIEAVFYGTEGSAAMRNVGGSFYDFVAEHRRGTTKQTISEPPDDWGGRAVVEWARRLSAGERYDASVEHLVEVAAALDAIYGR